MWACDVAETCLPSSNPDFDESVSMMGEVGGLGRCDSGTPAAAMECLVTATAPAHFRQTAKIQVPIGDCVPDGTGKSYSVPSSCFPPGTDFSRGCPRVTDCAIDVQLHGDEHCTSNHNYMSCQATGTSDDCMLTTETQCAKSLFDAGWDCHGDVMWAKNVGIDQHPEWYGSLTSSSSISDIHAYIHALPACSPEQSPPCAPHYCTRPCYSSQEVQVCWVDLRNAQSYGELLSRRMLNVCMPDGQGGSNIIGAHESDFTYQPPCPDSGAVIDVRHFPNSVCAGIHDHRYSALMDGMALDNCCNEDASSCDLSCKADVHIGECRNLAPIEDAVCANQIHWAMTEGIQSHPEWYTGLSVDSSHLDFQLYLSTLPRCSDNGSVPPCYGGETSCPPPCPSVVQ